MIPYGKTFYNQRRRQSVHHYYYKEASPTADQSSESSGFHDNREISEPSSPISLRSQHCSSSPDQLSSHVHAPQIPANPGLSQPFRVHQNLGYSEFAPFVEAPPTQEIHCNPSPSFQDNDYRQNPPYFPNPRKINPRANPVVRFLRKSSINTVITHLLKTVPQEYTVLAPEKRYQKCVNYFAELLKQGNDDPRTLPCTIIYTPTYRQAYSLSICMEKKCNIPSLYAPATATDEELKEMIKKCHTKEFPILILESRTFEQSIDNIDLVINYTVPSTIEEYGRRLACIVHKKCITFVASDEDRQFLRKVLDILDECHQKPPQSLEALFAFDADNLERYIREFKTAESWIDLIDMD